MTLESLVLTAQIYNSTSSILGIIVLILQIVVIVSVLLGHGSKGHKLLWTIVILFLPILGLILYFFLGRNASDRPILE